MNPIYEILKAAFEKGEYLGQAPVVFQDGTMQVVMTQGDDEYIVSIKVGKVQK